MPVLRRSPDPTSSAADLSAYVDGELGPVRRRRIARHLRRCEICARFVEQLRAVRALAGELEPPEISDELRAELTAAFAAHARGSASA